MVTIVPVSAINPSGAMGDEDIVSPSAKRVKLDHDTQTDEISGYRVVQQENRTIHVSSSHSYILDCQPSIDSTDTLCGVEAKADMILFEKETSKKWSCTCGRSKCLKQYCVCFRNNARCTSACSCSDCHNDGLHAEDYARAVGYVKTICSNTIKRCGYESSLSQDATQRVCKCKHSKCSKKYCECFNSQVHCTSQCSCIDCRNSKSPSSSCSFRRLELFEQARQAGPLPGQYLSSTDSTQYQLAGGVNAYQAEHQSEHHYVPSTQNSSPASWSVHRSGTTDPRNQITLLSIPNSVDEENGQRDNAVAVYGDGEKRRLCTCAKTKCLKQYCQCFRDGFSCSASCTCIDCYNDGCHEDERLSAVKTVLLRPCKMLPPQNLQNLGARVVISARRLCRCKQSRCLKKYCECFSSGISCTPLCSCMECSNMQLPGPYVSNNSEAMAPSVQGQKQKITHDGMSHMVLDRQQDCPPQSFTHNPTAGPTLSSPKMKVCPDDVDDRHARSSTMLSLSRTFLSECESGAFS